MCFEKTEKGLKGKRTQTVGQGRQEPIEEKATGITNNGPCVDRTRGTAGRGTRVSLVQHPQASGCATQATVSQLPGLWFLLLVYPLLSPVELMASLFLAFQVTGLQLGRLSQGAGQSPR